MHKATARSCSPSIPVVLNLALPPTVAEFHSFVTLSADYFFVQCIPFLHTTSRDFFFRTCLPPRGKSKASKQDMLIGLYYVLSLYQSRNLTVSQIKCDNEFACVQDAFFPIFFNVVATEEHVGDVERSIRTSKQDARSLIHGLPFSSCPREIIIGADVSALQKRNSLSNHRGISPTSAQAALTQVNPPPDYHLVSKLDFDDYVHTYEGTSNTMEPHTQPATTLYLSGNLIGG